VVRKVKKKIFTETFAQGLTCLYLLFFVIRWPCSCDLHRHLTNFYHGSGILHSHGIW